MDGTVLIADDDRTIRTVLTQALTRAGCRVHATGSLAQLGRWVAEARPDLVITDVVMPKLGGIALYRTMRQEGQAVRFLFTSGYAAHEIMRGDLADGELALLQKPWTLADLTTRVREVLDRSPRTEPA